MSRRHVQHLLSEYIDGSLSSAETRAVEAHLITCGECAQELAHWRAVLRLISQFAPMSCPVDCSETVRATIEARRTARLIGEELGARNDVGRSGFFVRLARSVYPLLPGRWAATLGQQSADQPVCLVVGSNLSGSTSTRVRGARELLPALSAVAFAAMLLAGGVWLRGASKLHQTSAVRQWELAGRTPGRALPVTADPRLTPSRALAPTGAPVRAHAPDRLQEAFGRSDSLILAADFVEDDR